MRDIVFIQENAEGEPYSAGAASAERGFASLGYVSHRFRPGEVRNLPLEPSTVVVGGMKVIYDALTALGVRVPILHSAPAVLEPFLGRASWRTTEAELLHTNRFPVFVKPFEDVKAFTGCVVESPEVLRERLERTGSWSADNALLAQEVVTFVSEWRVYVMRGQAVGVAHYRGDLLTFPASGIVRAVMGAYTNPPAGYGADFGITDTGRTVLVEVNDGYALGFYAGIADARYAELLRARWHEMTGA